jgi:hypothetical protein
VPPLSHSPNLGSPNLRRGHAGPLTCALAFLLLAVHAYGQNASLNILLQLDAASAEQTLHLLEGQPVSTDEISGLRGSVIAASTTGEIANRDSLVARLRDYCDSLKYGQHIQDDVYRLEEAQAGATEIRELFNEMTTRNFSRRVVATVEQVFPEEAVVQVTIPIYLVAFGHENVDAYVRRIVWEGDTPHFVGESAGELTIVVNLAQAVRFGDGLDERFISLLGVVAHEVFHAAFSAYKETSPAWKRWYRRDRGYLDELLDLTQNEGIAYYLSLDQRGRGYVPRDWQQRTREAVNSFNANAAELLAQGLSHRRAAELLRTANLAGYWESYGSMTGMLMAREIDLRLGRKALIESIALGPIDFFRKYAGLTTSDNTLPPFTSQLLSVLKGRNRR